MISKQQLIINQEKVQYYLTRRDQKNLILRFREGQIYLSAPFDCPNKTINQFIGRNLSRILDYRETYRHHRKINLEGQKWILVFGQPLAIELTLHQTSTRIIENKLIIHNINDEKELVKKIYQFLAKYYKNWFLERTIQWAKVLGVDPPTIQLRVMVSKWGICYPQRQKVTYNTKLIHYSPHIIDYVIVHELTHLIHPNHSRNFWQSVGSYLPNYLELKSGLRA